MVEPTVCRTLALTTLSEFKCVATNAEGVGVLRGLTVRSRIGTQVVVELPRQTGAATQAPSAQLILRKVDIILWVRP